jgi:hypothetical protein
VWSSCSNSLTACASASSVMFSASTRVHGSLPSHQDSDPSCCLHCSMLGQSIPTLQDWRKSQLNSDATTSRYSHLRKQRIIVVTYVTFLPTSRLDRQHGYVLTIISISVVWAATRRGTGVRELPSWRLLNLLVLGFSCTNTCLSA